MAHIVENDVKMSEGIDKLGLIAKRLTYGEFCVTRNFSVALRSPFLKIWKSECSKSSFTSQVFLVLRNIEMSIQALFLTHNEEALEEVQFSADTDADIDLIAHYVSDRIQSANLGYCPGVSESSVLSLNVDPHHVIIEKFGKEITYRSRNCTRAVESLTPGQLCVSCQTWIQNNLEMEMSCERKSSDFSKEDPLQNLELAVLPDLDEDLEAYNGFDDIADSCLKEEDEDDKKGNSDVNTSKIGKARDRKCTYCKQRFKTQQELYKHIKVCNPSVQFRSCDQCDNIFMADFQLKNHVSVKHSDGVGTFPCPLEQCNKLFKIHLGKRMRNHIENIHRIDPDNPPESIKERFLPLVDDVPRVAGTGRRVYPCTFPGCTYVGKDVTALRYHQPVHTGESLYCCTTCGKSFRYKKELYLCEKRHKGEFNYFCENCDKKFISKQKLDMHTRTHTGEKPFGCFICSFRCARKDNLNTHTKKHHGLTLREAELQHRTGGVVATFS